MDFDSILLAKKLGGGGGSSVDVESLSVTANGTYTAEEGKAYSPVNVNVDSSTAWLHKDGNTYLHINIYNDYYLTVNMKFYQSATNGNTIYWGDGESTTPTSSGRALQTHTYAQKGEYEIKIVNNSGEFSFGDTSTIKGFIFQDGITDGNQTKFEHFCTILKKVEIGTGWKASDGRQFASCKDLSEVYFSVKPTATKLDNHMFGNCVSLSSVDGVTGWNTGFTSLGNNVFSGTALQKNVVFPNVTAIPNSFNYNVNTTDCPLSEIEIWNGVETIGNDAFNNCADVCEIVIPSSVTSIGTNAFANANGVHAIHIKATTPPTLSNANTFSGAPTYIYDFKIYVPSASLATYQGASIWSTWSSYMIGE